MTKKSYPLILLLFPLLLRAQKNLPANMFLHTLPNGLDVLVVEDNSVPLATIMITCKNGAYTETPQFNGLSHLYEHMFFKANKDYSSQEEFLNRVGDLGMQFNGSTSFEYVNYYFTLPAYNLKQGLKFMNSAIRYPKFDEREMEKEKLVVDDEFQRQESNPGFALNDAMEHHLWGGLYSRKNPIGNHKIINTATPDLMDSIRNKYYFPNNSLLTVAGDVKHDDVFKDIEKIYGGWTSSGFDPFKKWPVPEFDPLTKTDYFIVESNLSKVPVMRFEWQGPDTRNNISATYAADIFSYILSQNSSKLSKALVQTGLATSVSIGYTTLAHVGPISLNVVPNPDKIKECLAEVKKQIAQWDMDDYLTDDQIETAKVKFIVRKAREEEVTTDFVQVLSFWWSAASLDYFAGYTDNLQKVNKSDLQGYVKKYIKDKPYCAGLLISPDLKEKIKPEEFFKEN
ncbi:MAG TPA: pitrilysin family protein [Mucilaginibacter sp.]|jgi:zinc protease